ncbi:MAG: PAS domain-containing protein [Gammaproteobacteria bacterium]
MEPTSEGRGEPGSELEKLRTENASLRQLATSLTRAIDQADDRDASWLFALEGNRDGVWDWNAVTGEVYFSRRWKEMLGYEENEISNRLSEWDERVHPDDREQVYVDLGDHLEGRSPYYENEHRVRSKDGSYRWILDRGRVVSWTDDGKPLRVVGTHTDVTVRKEAEREREALLASLREANSRIRELSGLLPICVSCKKIRDADDRWRELETYIREHSAADFSHCLCPACTRSLYPELYGGKT